MDDYIHILEQYAVLRGRTSRKEYWMFMLFNVIVFFSVLVIGVFLMGITRKAAFIFLPVAYVLAIIIPLFSASVRRLHDTGRSAWWLLVYLIPFLGGIWILVLLCLRGTEGANMFGVDPRGEGASTAEGAAVPTNSAAVAHVSESGVRQTTPVADMHTEITHGVTIADRMK